MAKTNSNHDDNIDGINVRGDKVWSKENEEKLITLLEEEIMEGNRPTTTLTKEAWKIVRTKLNESVEKKYAADR